jgi:hypothetical protein
LIQIHTTKGSAVVHQHLYPANLINIALLTRGSTLGPHVNEPNHQQLIYSTAVNPALSAHTEAGQSALHRLAFWPFFSRSLLTRLLTQSPI